MSLITTLPASATQITSGDYLHASVDNVPHNQLNGFMTAFNSHHDGALIHNGNFTIQGDLTVQGTLFNLNTTNTLINDNNITVNKGQASKLNAGFRITSVTGDIAFFTIDSLGYWQAGRTGQLRRVAVYNSNRTLSLPATGTGQAAITLELAESIRNNSSPPTVSLMNDLSMGVDIPAQKSMISFESAFDVLCQNIWVATTSMALWRFQCSGFGTQNNAVICGGKTGPAENTISSYVDRFNGNSWLSVGSMTTVHARHGAAGVGNAGVAFFGSSGTNVLNSRTEIYDGNAWSLASPVASTPRSILGACGSRNAALIAGGYYDSTLLTSGVVEKWSGVTFSAQASLLTPVWKPFMMGTINSAICTGGNTSASSPVDYAQIYNGVSNVWYYGPAMAGVRYAHGGAGVKNNCLVWSGGAAGYAQTEKFNGVFWKTVTPTHSDINMTTKPWTSTAVTHVRDRAEGGSAGTANAALYGGGGPNSVVYNSYRWFGEIRVRPVIWHDGEKVENYSGVLKTKTDLTTGYTVLAQVVPEWNTGETEAERAELSELSKDSDLGAFLWVQDATVMTSSRHGGAAVGGPTNTIVFGGGRSLTGVPTYWTSVEKLSNGVWSTLTPISRNHWRCAGWGTPRAAVANGDFSGGGSVTDIFNGSSWSAGTSHPLTNIYDHKAAGTSLAAILAGGVAPAERSDAYRWNGSVFTATGSMNRVRAGHSLTGMINAAITMGSGYNAAYYDSEIYNGATWVAAGYLSTNTVGRGFGSATGQVNNSLYVGGVNVSSNLGISWCEKFNGIYWQATAYTVAIRAFLQSTGSGNDTLAIGGYSHGVSTDSLNTVERYRWNPFMPLDWNGSVGKITY